MIQEVKQEKVVVKRDATQWFDVGIIKTTTTVVSHYHLPSETGQANGDVSIGHTVTLTGVLFLSNFAENGETRIFNEKNPQPKHTQNHAEESGNHFRCYIACT